MTITSYTPTQLQQDLDSIFQALRDQLPDAAETAVNAYVSIVNVPTLSNLITLNNALEAASLTTDEFTELQALRSFKNIVEVELNSLRIGNPTNNLILTNAQYPMDDLGVTYSSILSDLKTVLADNTNIDTVEHFANAIFYTINAINPQLSLVQLTDDIQATVDSGVSLSTLASNMLTSLNAINTAASVTISNAVYNHVFSREQANLYNDIVNTEKLYNLNQVKENLKAACQDVDSNVNGFATAVFNSMLGLSSPALSLTRVKEDVEAGIANPNVSNLSTLKANILTQLNAINDLDTTHTLLRDAVFFTNGLIPSSPHDLKEDLPPANTLLGLQHIRIAIMDALDDFTGTTSDDLAGAIRNAIYSISDTALTLPSSELANDIAASGDVSTLATALYTSLSNLNVNTLTASSLANALYANGLIVSGHKKNFVDDLTARQTQLNYLATRQDMVNDINAATDVDGLANAVFANLASSSHTLTLNKLTRDIQATIASGVLFVTLKANLVTALNNLASNNIIGAQDVVDSLYANDKIISSDLADLTTDINAAETALDYRELTMRLATVCQNVIQGSITEASVFAESLVNTVKNFPSTAITEISVPANIQEALTFAINNSLYNNNNLVDIATDIKANLDNLIDNQIFSAEAIDAAIFNVFHPSDDTRLFVDATATENFKTLYAIKTGLVNLCPRTYDVDPTPASCAAQIINTVKNSNSFTPDISEAALANDITATIAQGTMVSGQPSMFQSLMYNITSNLNNINTNALSTAGIKQSLYNNNNAIVSAVPYLLANDLINANSLKNIKRIKVALLAYLQGIDSEDVDTSSITMAKGMLHAINISGTNIVSELSDLDLNADISYTISQKESAFAAGNYLLAQALVTALNAAADTDTAIEDAVFNEDSTIMEVHVLANPELYNDDSDGDLLTYIRAVNTASKSYNLIIQDIVSNLNALSGPYTSLDVANAIVNAIVVTGDRTLTAELLQANIDATSGDLSSKVAALVSELSTLASEDTTDVNAVKAALFASMSAPGVLAESTTNADNLLADIETSVGLTDNYQAIINQIKNNLNNISMVSLLTTDSRAGAIANAIVNGVNTIATGPNGSLLQQFLRSADVKADILHTSSDLSGLATLKTTLINRLNALTGADVSAAGIKGAIYDETNAIKLTTANSLYTKYLTDLEASAAAHSSFLDIKNNFASNLDNYSDSAAADLSSDISASIIGNSGVNLVTTQNQLTGGVAVTIGDNNPVTAIPDLASNIGTSVNQADISSVVTAGANIANAVFGNNIALSYDASLLKQDVLANKISREPNFYQNIVGNYLNAFSVETALDYGTRDLFGVLLFSTLNAYNPTWTYERVGQDVVSSSTDSVNPVKALNDVALASNFRTSLGGITSFTASNIANAFYTNNVLVESDADKLAMQADVGAEILYYGGNDSLAARVIAALQNLDPEGYTESDVATAIVTSITPALVNPSPELLESYVAYDLAFTQSQRSTSLTNIVASLITRLGELTRASTAENFDSAVYNDISGIISTDRDEINFALDIASSRDDYNNYAAVKTNLGVIDNTDTNDAVTSILSALELNSNNLTNIALTSTFNNNLASTNIGALVNQINTNVASADVTTLASAPMNLVLAFYPPLKSVSSYNFITDIDAADQIDNAVTVTSAIGTSGVCTNGASHVVYACTKSNNVATVGDLIATNDCSVSGAVTAARACDLWAYSQVDHYISYDGAICSGYLSGQEAALACKIGLDLSIA